MSITIKKGLLFNQRRIYLMMDLASTCDINCKQCFRTVEPPKSARMSLEQIGILESEVFPYLRSLALSCCGEPLTLRHFKEGLRAAKRSGVPFVRIQTNGTHLTEEMSHFLIVEGLDSLGISLDASSKRTFENIRRGASWETVIENLRGFSRLRQQSPAKSPLFSFNFTLMKENAAEAVDFIRLAEEIGADTIGFSHLLIESWEMRDWSLIYEPNRYNALLTELRVAAAKTKIPVRIPDNIPDRLVPFKGPPDTAERTYYGECTAAEEDWFFLMPNGDLFPCANLNSLEPTGNVFRTSFKEIWYGRSNQEFRRNALLGCVEGCDRCKTFASTLDTGHEESYLAPRLTTHSPETLELNDSRHFYAIAKG